MKYHSILLIFLLVSSTLFAAAFDKRAAVQELLQKLEAIDPNIKSHQDDWLKVRSHLEQAAQQSESEAGLKLSVQHILDQWGGLHFRIMDRDEARYWALSGEQLALPDAWFAQRGAKWLVQYSENKMLNRGDSAAAKDFSPFSKDAQAASSWTIPLQTKLMGDASKVTVPLTRKPLKQWALDLTQSSSLNMIVDNRRVCIEKVWFWLDSAVAHNIASKLDDRKSLCKGIVLDLRDVFGEPFNEWPKLAGKVPLAVLTNNGTMDGAVKLAKLLKTEGKAKIFGEPTGSASGLQAKEALAKSSWMLVVVGDGGELIPDQLVRDSFLNTEGVDTLRDAGLSWVRGEIMR